MSLTNFLITPDGKPEPFPSKLLTWTLICCGALALYLGGSRAIWEQQARPVGFETIGTVIKNVSIVDGRDHSTKFYPVVKFLYRADTSLEFQSNFGAYPPMYYPGENVPVLYDMTNPKNAEVNSFSIDWFPIILCFAVGVIFSAFGLYRLQKTKIL